MLQNVYCVLEYLSEYVCSVNPAVWVSLICAFTDSMGMSLSELRELVMDWEARDAAIHGVTKSRTRLSNWTELNWTEYVH